MDKDMLKKLGNFEAVWARVNSCKEQHVYKCGNCPKLMPKKGKKGRTDRFVPYSR